ncbi:MAG: type I-E CRISPR-associated protein Cas6/Cse3/CasE [Gammaproteobacteria bacterium]|nr:type I-E CRISPR-associated protein Cas6/Cse3/CasE [Gammaproteobacteria bacterium]
MSDIRFHLSRVTAPNKIIKSAHGAHKVFWRAFPDSQPGDIQPFQFRAEDDAPETDRQATLYLVQSRDVPHWENVLGLQAKTKPVHLRVLPGEYFYFRLLASPVASTTRQDEEGKRIRGGKSPMRDRKSLDQWFAGQAKKHGFMPVSYVFSIGKQEVRRADAEKRFKLAACQFDGQLRVTDPSAFGNALCQGVGPKKAFGFGMLSVTR